MIYTTRKKTKLRWFFEILAGLGIVPGLLIKLLPALEKYKGYDDILLNVGFIFLIISLFLPLKKTE